MGLTHPAAASKGQPQLVFAFQPSLPPAAQVQLTGAAKLQCFFFSTLK